VFNWDRGAGFYSGVFPARGAGAGGMQAGALLLRFALRLVVKKISLSGDFFV
jgi:hypothetical protein